nr:hypothetical protein [Micromonospora sp. DSM 115978]
AVPTGFAAGLPFGVTLIGPAGTDGLLADLAEDVHRRSGLPVGVGAHWLAARPEPGTSPDQPPASAVPGYVELAVVGAHMAGLALNDELVRTGAHLVSRTRTTADYRLFAIPAAGSGPRRPGLVRVSVGGAAIDAEIWRMPATAVGPFLTGVPAPLAVGTVDTEFGRTLGFVCEAVGTQAAEDVTAFGGWRRYLAETGTPTAG